MRTVNEFSFFPYVFPNIFQTLLGVKGVDPSVRVPIVGILKNLVRLYLQNCCVDLIYLFYHYFWVYYAPFFFNILSPSSIILFIDGDSIYNIVMIDLILIFIN